MPGNRRKRVFLFPFGNNKWGNLFSACVLRPLGQVVAALLVVDGQTEDDYGFGIRKKQNLKHYVSMSLSPPGSSSCLMERNPLSATIL